MVHYFLGEILSWRGKVGLLLGFLGIGLIASPQLMDGQTPFAACELKGA
jgi:drug/metabolite transporter (DMT)-like permease